MTLKSALEYLKDFDSYTPYQEAINKVSDWIELFQVNYEARLKVDMVAMLTELQSEIEEYQKIHDSYCDHYIKDDVWEHHTREHYDSSSGKAIACDYCLKTIQQKINALKAESEDKKRQ